MSLTLLETVPDVSNTLYNTIITHFLDENIVHLLTVTKTQMSPPVSYSLSIVRLAVDAVVLDEAGRLPVEGQLTDAAPQAVRVPRAAVDLQQVLVCDWLGASCAHPVLRLRTTQCQVTAYTVSIQPVEFQTADRLNHPESAKLLPIHSQHTAR
jgi:hypothetical protein